MYEKRIWLRPTDDKTLTPSSKKTMMVKRLSILSVEFTLTMENNISDANPHDILEDCDGRH